MEMPVYVPYKMERLHWAFMRTCWFYKIYTSHKRLSWTPPKTTITLFYKSLSLKGGTVTRHPCDTFHRFLPQLATICHNLWSLSSPQNSTNFYSKDNPSPPPESVYTHRRAHPVPIPYSLYAYSPSNQVNDINPSLLSPTFFLYTMSWLHHTVHVHSLIISTLLYIIVAYTYSVTVRHKKNI